MTNRIKNFVKNHEEALLGTFIAASIAVTTTAAVYMAMRANAAEAALKERGRPVIIDTEILDQYAQYHLNNPM